MIYTDRSNRFLWIRNSQIYPVLIRDTGSALVGRSFNKSLFVNMNGDLDVLDIDAGKDIVGKQLGMFADPLSVPHEVPDTKMHIDIGQLDSLCHLLGVESFSAEIKDPNFCLDKFLLNLLVASRINPAMDLDEFEMYRVLVDTLASSYYLFHEIFVVSCGYDPEYDWSEP